MAHLHPVYDTDPHFAVDSTSRVISYSSKEKLLLVQGDHNCQRYTFEMPRYIDGHDMTKCDRVEIHYTNIDGSNNKYRSYGLYKVTDMQTSTEDENVLVFSWLISHQATLYVGITNFIIRFACTTKGEIDYVWNTGVYTSVVIASTIDNSENVIGQYYENLIPENIKAGVDIGGVLGTYGPVLQDKTATPSNSQQEIVPDADYSGLSKVTISPVPTEEKTVNQNGVVTPTEGKYLSKVTVEVPGRVPVLQDKSVNPGTSQQEVTADEGYDGLSKVTVSGISIEEKPVTISNEGTTEVTPSDGKYLSKVTVTTDTYLKNTADATAEAGMVLSGKTAYAKGAKVTGTIPTYGGTTENIVGETWTINETFPTIYINDEFASFTSRGQTFTGFKIVSGENSGIKIMYGATEAYDSSIEWVSDEYRILEFSTPPTGELLTCLQQIAVKQTTGSTPVELTSPNGMVFKVKEAYCNEDIRVAPLLQEKTITPSTSKQAATVDLGYAGLSKVIVSAVSTEEKTVTANGEVTPSEGKFLSKVTVNVPAVGRPVLNAPTISLDGDTLTITNPSSNGDFISKFKIFVDGAQSVEQTGNTLDLSTFFTVNGTYSITVKCSGENFEDSAESNAIAYTYTVLPQLATPTITIDGNTLKITDVENATSYDVYVDGTLKTNVAKAPAGPKITTLSIEDSSIGKDAYDIYIKFDGVASPTNYDARFKNSLTSSVSDGIYYNGVWYPPAGGFSSPQVEVTVDITATQWSAYVAEQQYVNSVYACSNVSQSISKSTNGNLYPIGIDNNKFVVEQPAD